MEVRVNKGDSIWKIAKARKPEGVSTADFVQQILDANDLEDPDKIKPGQILNVPGEEPPTPRPRPISIGPGTATTGAGQGAEAIGEIAVQPASNEDMLLLAKRSEVLQQRDQLGNLASELKARYGNVRVTAGGPPLPPTEAERHHPVKAQKREQGVVDEVMAAAGFPAGKDQSRLPEEVMLDLDVLGLTPQRPQASLPMRNPDYATLPAPRSTYVAQAAKLSSAPDRASFTVGDPGGLIEEGNIDLGTRPRRDNDDGTFSTILSKSFEEDGVEVLIPSLDPDGNEMSDADALARYHETGEHLGKFDTPNAATAYAIRLSERQNPNIPRDPDHYIDLGSERWRDVFIRAPAEVHRTRREASRAEERTRQMKPPNPRPRPTPRPEQMKQMQDMVRTATQGPSFQPTRMINGSK